MQPTMVDAGTQVAINDETVHTISMDNQVRDAASQQIQSMPDQQSSAMYEWPTARHEQVIPLFTTQSLPQYPEANNPPQVPSSEVPAMSQYLQSVPVYTQLVPQYVP